MSETKQKTTGLVWIIIIIVIMLFAPEGILSLRIKNFFRTKKEVPDSWNNAWTEKRP